jgi:hypothetical protein
MSMFASRTQKDVEVKVGDTVETVTLRKLSGVSLDKAEVARRMEVIQTVRSFGTELFAAMGERKAQVEADAAVAPAPAPAPKPEPTPEEKAAKLKAMQEVRYNEYDRQLVLQAGIVRWTAPEIVNPANIADLDEGVSVKLHREILDISLPSLDPDVLKNG